MKLDGGLRLDESRYFGGFLSPRLALVWQASPRTVYKLVYARPFRNPSAFEQFYNDGGLSYAAAAPLHPESANTFEASLERRLPGSWTLTANAYQYRLSQVIETVNLADDVQQYRNTGRDRSSGLELELSGKLGDRLEATASTALGVAAGGPSLTRLANSPSQIDKVRLGAPLLAGAHRDRLFLAAAFSYTSARNSWTGDRLGGFPLVDLTATLHLSSGCDLQAGVRNALDRRYEDPIYLAVDRLRGDLRSAFVSLVWRPWE